MCRWKGRGPSVIIDVRIGAVIDHARIAKTHAKGRSRGNTLQVRYGGLYWDDVSPNLWQKKENFASSIFVRRCLRVQHATAEATLL
jgi:hypothetical protein